MDTFDASAVKGALLVSYLAALDVTLTVTAGSVNVEARLIVASGSDALALATLLLAETPATLSAKLNVHVTAKASPTVERTLLAAPPPPSSNMAPPGIPQPGAGNGGTSLLESYLNDLKRSIGWAGMLGAAVTLACACAGCAFFCGTRAHRFKHAEKRHRTAGHPVHADLAEVSESFPAPPRNSLAAARNSLVHVTTHETSAPPPPPRLVPYGSRGFQLVVEEESSSHAMGGRQPIASQI